MMKASDLFIQCLEEEGVEYIFGVPGEENLDLLEVSRRSSKIKLILTRHEQGAGFMAATYGRHTGRTGVCLATLGPGATNLVTAAAYAQLGGMPMMMITGQKPIKTSKQGRFQILDVVDMMQPITKYTHQLASSDNIPAVCARRSGWPRRRSPARSTSNFRKTSPTSRPTRAARAQPRAAPGRRREGHPRGGRSASRPHARRSW